MTNTLSSPSLFHVKAVCSVCGHEQFPYAINAIFDGEEMVECYVGSSGDFCDVCEDKGLPAMTMEQEGWLHVNDLPDEWREFYTKLDA